MRRAFAGAASLAFAIVATGCASTEGVVRVVDERPIAGPFVPSEAYAAYLRGSIAEASGDLAGAVEGYAIAVALGPRDPEPWTKLGEARCARDPRDPKADDAIASALSIDGSYAPAWEARAQCAAKRGDRRTATESARRAVEADPSSASALASLADGWRGPPEEMRARLLAMTLVARTDVGAWSALASWARGHGDRAMEARALGEIVTLAPSRGAEIDADVARIARGGDASAARALASTRLANAQHGSVTPLVARLAIDDALFAGDIARARRAATVGHVPLVVVAARALLVGDAHTAREIAEEVAASDPANEGARLVLAAAADALHDPKLAARAFATPSSQGAPVAAEAWLVFARVVAREGSVEGARALLGAMPREPVVPGDPLTTPVAVALAKSGALDDSKPPAAAALLR